MISFSRSLLLRFSFIVLLGLIATVLHAQPVTPPLHGPLNGGQGAEITKLTSAATAAQNATISGTGAELIEGFAGKIVGAIEIRGIKRIEKDAVLAKIGAKVGQPLTAEQIRTDIQALFNMGFFDDIEVLGEQAAGRKGQLSSTRCANGP